jgi:hypothetical protein
MFKNALHAEHKGTHWGVIAGAVAFAMLMAVGYILVSPIV